MALARRHRILTLASAILLLLTFTSGPARAEAPAVAADVATSTATGDGAASSTTIVASEGPDPGAGAGGLAPEIGPIVVPGDESSFAGAWWLVAFGGLQLVGLFFIARRARARLSTDDARP